MLNRTKVKNISIYILLGITYGIEAFSLEFNPSLVIGEPLCPMDILMTCKAVNIGPLRWFAVIDDDNTCTFAVHDSYKYDFNSSCLPGVSENYTSIRINAPFFDINTTLNINLISLAPVMGVYCHNETNIIDVDIKIQGPAPKPIINSCCSGDHEVPVNSAKCSIVTSTSEVTLYFEWSLQYTSVNRVESYSVRTCSFNDSFPECSTPVVVNSNVNFTVTLPSDHCIYISAINCGNQESEYTRLNVSSNALGDMFRVNYTATYSEDGMLKEIVVKWEDVMDTFVCNVNTTYEVELRTDGSSKSMSLNTENCSNKVCLVIFQDLMDKRTGSYEVRVVASNQFINETEVYTSSITIVSNIMDIIEKNGCNLSIRCPTSFNGKCRVLNDLEDSSSSEVDQLSRTFNITLSISRQKIPLEVLTFNDSLRVILKYNYTTDDMRMTDTNVGLLAFGLTFLLASFVLLLISIYVIAKHKHTFDKSKLWRPSLICLAIEICLILVLIFWYIAVGVVVARQPDTCDSSWQSTRDGLIWTAFLLSLLNGFLGVIVNVFYCSHSGSEQQKTNTERVLELHGVDTLRIDERGISETEKYTVQGHKKVGENTTEATLRVKDVITDAVKETQETNSNVYDTTEYAAMTQNKEAQRGSAMYSMLNRAKNVIKPQPQDSEYSPLQHKTARPPDRASAIAATNSSTTSDVPGASTAEYGQLYRENDESPGRDSTVTEQQSPINKDEVSTRSATTPLLDVPKKRDDKDNNNK